jgi:hypothetical protein
MAGAWVARLAGMVSITPNNAHDAKYKLRGRNIHIDPALLLAIHENWRMPDTPKRRVTAIESPVCKFKRRPVFISVLASPTGKE